MIREVAAEALFVSPLQRSDEPHPFQVDTAVTAALLLHGSDGCAALMAQEFGDHPESSAARMRWCLSLTERFQPAAKGGSSTRVPTTWRSGSFGADRPLWRPTGAGVVAAGQTV